MTKDEMAAAMAAFKAKGGQVVNAPAAKPDKACSASRNVAAKAAAQSRAAEAKKFDRWAQRFD